MRYSAEPWNLIKHNEQDRPKMIVFLAFEQGEDAVNGLSDLYDELELEGLNTGDTKIANSIYKSVQTEMQDVTVKVPVWNCKSMRNSLKRNFLIQFLGKGRSKHDIPTGNLFYK